MRCPQEVSWLRRFLRFLLPPVLINVAFPAHHVQDGRLKLSERVMPASLDQRQVVQEVLHLVRSEPGYNVRCPPVGGAQQGDAGVEVSYFPSAPSPLSSVWRAFRTPCSS